MIRNVIYKCYYLINQHIGIININKIIGSILLFVKIS